MIAGLASALPVAMTRGLTSQGVPLAIAHKVAGLPSAGSLFAAFLGYNPVAQLLTPTGTLAHLPPARASVLTGKKFLPELISGPFHHGLVIVFSMAMAVPVIAALASLLRGGRYVHEEGVSPVTPPVATPSQAGVAAQADGAAAGNGSGLGNGAAAGKSSKIPSSDVRAEDSRATP